MFISYVTVYSMASKNSASSLQQAEPMFSKSVAFSKSQLDPLCLKHRVHNAQKMKCLTFTDLLFMHKVSYNVLL